MSRFFFAMIACSLMAGLSSIACQQGNQSSLDGNQLDADDGFADAQGDDGTAMPTNRAMVFPLNPVTTPNPIEVDLAEVADDADGILLSTAGNDGLRKIHVVSCVDEGETNVVNTGNGPTTQRICTLRSRANKEDNGNFAYEDWTDGITGVFNPDDVYAEVSLYYHVNKIYKFITSEEVGVFDRLPDRHRVDDQWVPLTLVANYRSPSGNELMPYPAAMYLRHEHLQMGMGAIMGLTGIPGDLLLFGQGPRADFAYEGETVYHEFGHLINEATSGISFGIYPDQYGLANLTNALEQGLSETFVFLVSGRSSLFEYLEQTTSTGGFLREVDSDARFPDNINGFDQFDGLVIAGANYEIFGYLRDEAGFTEADFARILLLALMDMKLPDDRYTFSLFADKFLQHLEAEGHTSEASGVREIFEARGLFETVRAKNTTGYLAQDHHALYIGGTINAPWNVSLRTMEMAREVRISPACVQFFLDVPQSITTASLQLMVLEMPDSMNMYPVDDDWDLRLYIRETEPVLYTPGDDGIQTVTVDRVLVGEREIVATPQGNQIKYTWSIDGLTPAIRTYLQVINYGSSQGVLADIEAMMGER